RLPWPRRLGHGAGGGLHVEAEVHHVTVLDDIFLAFQAPFARFLGAGFAVVLDEVVVADHLGTDKALLEVGVDHTGRLGRGGADPDGPGTYFLHASGAVGLQVQQLIAGADHPVPTRLVHAHGFEEHQLLFLVVQLGDLRLDLVAYRHHHGAFRVSDLADDVQIGVVLEAVLGDVGDVHDRLAGQ